ncbi:SDR family NAD(P)-dependent oxidoreductase [Mesorhizobium delmotii]|nr:SDR family NAD(P)-dependent oxidoreductase [Mesorhizobium delmotii]
MDLGLENKRVLITAGSAGIGRAAAEHFVPEGAKLLICHARSSR